MNIKREDGGNSRPPDRDLDEIRRAYSQVEGEEPPELLDLAIRNSARRAVAKKPRRIKFGWLHGLTTAAVFVLALSVIIHQRENQPAPGNGFLQFERPQAAPAASQAKKQSPAALSGRVDDALEKAADTAKDLRLPAPAAAVGEPRDKPPGEAFRESRQKVSAAPAPQSAAADIDASRAVPEKTIETKEENERVMESMADATEDAGVAASAKPAVVSTPPPAEPVTRSDADLQAERELQSIISMKRNGDENWKSALKTFTDNHPGYPLPDELKN